ncbi:hypothetical protein DFP95_11761 [Cohnella lupini]|uniref:Uncharacterized protein n=1 Tax=Cohnella lupini TaxID=1294267 RepID=A0A3D9I182_9BACL|nr:hypothetical protein DFP95_11761 [Cohnella lupini]
MAASFLSLRWTRDLLSHALLRQRTNRMIPLNHSSTMNAVQIPTSPYPMRMPRK